MLIEELYFICNVASHRLKDECRNPALLLLNHNHPNLIVFAGM